MHLSEVPPETNVRITAIEAGRGLTSRLAAMGLIPGTEITVAVNDMKGPVIVNVKTSKIALGRGMARKIIVRRPS